MAMPYRFGAFGPLGGPRLPPPRPRTFGAFPMQMPPLGHHDGRPPMPPMPPVPYPSNDVYRRPLPNRPPPIVKQEPVDAPLLFVGNIDERCSNELIHDLLSKCGPIENWKRMKGPRGKFPPFGFCTFAEHGAALLALQVLNNYKLGKKRLQIKVDEKAKQVLVDYVVKVRVSKSQLPKQPGHELAIDVEDEAYLQTIRDEVQAEIVKTDPNLEAEQSEPEQTPKSPKRSPSRERSSSLTREHRSRRRSPSRSHSRSRRQTRTRSRSTDSTRSSRSPRHRRSRSRKRQRRSHSSRSTPSTATRSSRERHSRRVSSRATDERATDSDRSDRKERSRKSKSHKSQSRKREHREKDEEYLRQLKKHEEHERRLQKHYAKEEEEDEARKKASKKEAQKLLLFFEEYNDERDDHKYYKGGFYFTRKRDYQTQRDLDLKDREEETSEIAAMQAQMRGTNDAHAKSPANESHIQEHGNNSRARDEDARSSDRQRSLQGSTLAVKAKIEEWTPVATLASTSQQEAQADASTTTPASAAPKIVTTFQPKTLEPAASVFGDDDDEDSLHVAKKKIKPFEITARDRIENATAEERKQIMKELVDGIPKSKSAVFGHSIRWNEVDAALIAERIKPWIEKKITEYIGDEEPSLVEFICGRVGGHCDPDRLLTDLAMILDDEAESFMIKLWRLIIYQTETKHLGLTVNSAST